MSPEILGRTSWPRPATFYESFCESEGIPIYRDLMGVEDVREVILGDWPRTGGRGAYIDLDGTGGVLGLYLAEIGPGKSLEPERHLYEEVFLVIEGRGTAEVWIDGQEHAKQIFEWQKNSLFSVPLNAHHRFVNATRFAALLLVATNAPPVMELYRDTRFVFETRYHFADRYRPDDPSYFSATEPVGTDEVTGRALKLGAIVPDTVGCDLPYDGQRGSGHRRFGVQLAGNVFKGFIAEYPAGRYSKTHAHDSGPVLVCLAGSGYTLTWPTEAGRTPWLDGRSHLVRRQEYRVGGIVSAAPGGSDWFHGHFGTAETPLRVMAFLGGHPARVSGSPGSLVVGMNRDVREGGHTIEYRDEDPEIRRLFRAALGRDSTFDMPDELYE